MNFIKVSLMILVLGLAFACSPSYNTQLCNDSNVIDIPGLDEGWYSTYNYDGNTTNNEKQYAMIKKIGVGTYQSADEDAEKALIKTCTINNRTIAEISNIDDPTSHVSAMFVGMQNTRFLFSSLTTDEDVLKSKNIPYKISGTLVKIIKIDNSAITPEKLLSALFPAFNVLELVRLEKAPTK